MHGTFKIIIIIKNKITMYKKQEQNNLNRQNIFQKKIKESSLKPLKDPSDNFLISITQKIYPSTYDRRKKLPKFLTQENSPEKEDQPESTTHKLKFPEIAFNNLIAKAKKSQDNMKQIIHSLNSKINKKSFIQNHYLKPYNQENQFMEDFNNVVIKKKVLTEGGVEDFREKKFKKPKIVRNNITKMLFENVESKRKLFSEDRSRKIIKDNIDERMEYTFYGGKKVLNKILLEEGHVEEMTQLNKIIDLKLRRKQ